MNCTDLGFSIYSFTLTLNSIQIWVVILLRWKCLKFQALFGCRENRQFLHCSSLHFIGKPDMLCKNALLFRSAGLLYIVFHFSQWLWPWLAIAHKLNHSLIFYIALEGIIWEIWGCHHVWYNGIWWNAAILYFCC